MVLRVVLRAVCLAASLLVATALAQGPPDAPPALAFAALEAQGVRIADILVRTENVFDLTDEREDIGLFRWANRLHITTRPRVIERALLFKRGEPVSVRLIEETERLLRSSRTLRDVQLRPVHRRGEWVDIEVVTRDAWSLDIGPSASRSGGENASGLRLSERNVLGSGVSLSFNRSRTADRSGMAFGLEVDRAFGTWTNLALSHADNSDGRHDALAVVRPFYALDARAAGGLTASRDDRLEAVHAAGVAIGGYRHRKVQAEVFAGLSAGLVDGWVDRWSAGLALDDDAYAAQDGLDPTAPLPEVRRWRGPFLRWEGLEDRIDRDLNRNLIGRPEFFSLGLSATVRLGRALRSLGSRQTALRYAVSVGRGGEPAPDHTLIATARLAGQQVEGALQQQMGLGLNYYLRQSPRWLFYAAAQADRVTLPMPHERLELGGTDGLRGHPRHAQVGTRRVLLSLEERFFTDWYPWRLFRVGGAAYLEAGRAWGGAEVAGGRSGWLSDLGAGLRIVSSRSAFSNVLHLDLALPLSGQADGRQLQFQVKTKTSF